MNRRGFFAGTVGLLFGKLSVKPTYTHMYSFTQLTKEQAESFKAEWMNWAGKVEIVPVLETKSRFNLVLEANSKPKRI